MKIRTESVSVAETTLDGIVLDLPLVKRIASIRSQSASRITWHSHDCFELLLATDGATDYEFSDETTVELTGGNFLAVAAGVRHRGNHDVRRPARLSGIMFDPAIRFATRYTPFTSADIAWMLRQFNAAAHQSRRMSQELRGLVNSLPRDFSLVDLSKPPAKAVLRLTICAILMEASKLLETTRAFEPTQTVDQAIAFMKSNLIAPESIESIAKAVQCSRAKLFQVFKDSTGMTPNDYWQRLRIDRAQELLRCSEKSITEVALDCGFSSSQYFSSVFRKYSGTSPTEFRMSIGE